MRGLYAIVDTDTLSARGHDPVAFARAVLDGGASVVQLRAKHLEGAETLALLRLLGPVCKASGVPLFANDRADLAWLAGVDGLHVGQGDVRPTEARALFEASGRRLRIGLSTHDEAQADAALAEPIDYLAIGPVFGTSSKERPDPTVGAGRALAIAKGVRERRPGMPVVAIGGIGLEEARALRGGVDAVAVIGALVPERGTSLDFTRERARALVDALGAP
jgi:thiamine-phosphate pyrophosphorylase